MNAFVLCTMPFFDYVGRLRRGLLERPSNVLKSSPSRRTREQKNQKQNRREEQFEFNSISDEQSGELAHQHSTTFRVELLKSGSQLCMPVLRS